MARTKEQLFEMYIRAAGLYEEEDGSFRTTDGKTIGREELRTSAEVAGFIDAVLGNSPRYLPPKGTVHQKEAAEDFMIDTIRSFVRMDDKYKDIANNGLLEEGKRRGYQRGYELGLENKGLRPRALQENAGRLEILAEEPGGSTNIVSLADYRARRG